MASDSGYGIAVDGAGQAYVTGFTGSAELPDHAVAQRFDTTLQRRRGRFRASSWTRPAPTCATPAFLGGSSYDWGNDIAIDSGGQAYVTGETVSRANFPAASAQATTPASTAAPGRLRAKLDAAGTESALRHLPRRGADDHGLRHRGWTVPGRRTSRADPLGGLPDRPGLGTTPASTAAPMTHSSPSWMPPAPGCSTPPSSAATALTRATTSPGRRRLDICHGRHQVSADFPAALGPGYDTTYNGPGKSMPSSSDCWPVCLPSSHTGHNLARPGRRRGAGRGRAGPRRRAGLRGAAGPSRGPLRDLQPGWQLHDRAGRGRHVPRGAVRRAGGHAAHHAGVPPARGRARRGSGRSMSISATALDRRMRSC